MITIILQGGLGNQMFQYAAAKALAVKWNTVVQQDLSIFKIHQHKSWCRPYELDVFDIEATKRFSTSFLNKMWLTLINQYGQNTLVKLLKRKSRVFDSSISTMEDWKSCSDNTILIGYFGTELYFKEYRTEILKDFQFKTPLDERNETVANQMKATNSVSVHIRRGDYLNEVNSKVFAQVSPEWYNRAIQKVQASKGATHFFFFSDDIEWCRSVFSEIENAVFVDWNHGSDSYRDMQLMSFCKHNIIPNSTFSWWGAWLNNNPDKMVIAPSVFFVDAGKNGAYRQNMPKEWLLM